MQNIIVATIKEWNIQNYFKLKEQFKDDYKFHLITNKDELTQELVKDLNPKYIFFPHWSWIIPKNIYNNFECIVFHMTDLPFGRGGSPLQNLIIRGIYDTKISALKVAEGLDTGDIYIKEDINISKGSAQEIFVNISNIIFSKMIPLFLNSKLKPIKQIGKVVEFKRRDPSQSNLATLEEKTITNIYDFIRMLDAEGYPNAYIQLDNNLKIILNNVIKKDSKIIGNFEVLKNE